MPGCAAVGCSNSDRKGFLMKRFPRDPHFRRLWAMKVKRKNYVPNDHSSLCEVHFLPEMWEKDRVDGKRKLKWNAVPTLFAHTSGKDVCNLPRKRSLEKQHVPVPGEKTGICNSKKETFSNLDMENVDKAALNIELSPNPKQLPLVEIVKETKTMGRQCFCCDERTGPEAVSLVLGHTPYSNTELPTKIGQLMGDNFMVIVTHDDVLCKRCSALFNHLDKLEFDIGIVKKALTGYLKKKYNLQDDAPALTDVMDSDSVKALQAASDKLSTTPAAPPIKISSVASLSESKQAESLLNSIAGKTASETPAITEKASSKKETTPRSESEDTTVYRCTSCKFTSTHFQLYMQHLKTHPKRTYFKCSECFKQFETREEAQQHIKDFHEASDGEYDSTKGKNVNGQDSLQAKRGYKCDECGYRYFSKEDYDEHLETHSRATIHECTVCSKRFKSKAYLLKHMKNHKIYKCGICGVTFKIKSNLLKHFSIHKKGDSYKIQSSSQMKSMPSVDDMSEGEEEEEEEYEEDETQELNVSAGEDLPAEGNEAMHETDNYDKVEEMLQALHSEEAGSLEKQDNELEETENEMKAVEEDKGSLVNANAPGEEEKDIEKMDVSQECAEPVNSDDKGESLNDTEEATIPDQNVSSADQIEKIDTLPERMSDLLENIKALSDGDASVEKLDLHMDIVTPHSDLAVELEQMDVQPDSIDGETESSALHMEKSDSMDSIGDIISSAAESHTGMDYSKILETKQILMDDIHSDICKTNELLTFQVSGGETGASSEAVQITCTTTNEEAAEDEKTETDNKIYVCSVCGLRGVSSVHIKTHFNSHFSVKQKIYKCNVCSKVLASPCSLKRHCSGHALISKRLSCEICKEELHDKIHMKQHMVAVHSDEVKCSICNESFQGKKACQEHELTHPEKQIYSCEDCELSFVSEFKLKVHRENVHSDTLFEMSESKVFRCHICSKIFVSFYTLKRHLFRRHKNFSQTSCNICSEHFSNYTQWRKHLTKAHPSFKECPFCSKVFENKETYKVHESTHRNHLPHECNICKKKFLNDSQLNRHKNIMHRELNCRECGKYISDPIKLWNHEKRHTTTPEQFPCKHCDKIFKTPGGLRFHQGVHTGNYPFYCEICGKGLYSKKRHEEHLASHTKEIRFVCDLCGRKFVSDSTYRIHRLWHENPLPYKCNICGVRFKHTSILSVHKRKHTGERPYKCPYCNKGFALRGTLKNHIVLHTKNFPYRCSYCNKGFTTRSKLTNHTLKVHDDDSLFKSRKVCEYKMVLKPSELPTEIHSSDLPQEVNTSESVSNVKFTSKTKVDNSFTCETKIDNSFTCETNVDDSFTLETNVDDSSKCETNVDNTINETHLIVLGRVDSFDANDDTFFDLYAL